jgi:hypothetical protein
MTWLPGQPVVTAEDRAGWQHWRRFRILKDQRDRRAKMRRIDYYVSPAANAVIDSMRSKQVGGDASSILNRIVADWAARNSETVLADDESSPT